jgi:nucleotide-binding universal stress UspA family protein
MRAEDIMKSILVPIEMHDCVSSMLECASRLAAPFSGTVEGAALRLPQVAVVGPDPVVTVTFPRAEEEDRELVASARRVFEAFFSQVPGGGAGTGPRATYRWRPGDPIDDAALGSIARVHDLTVVGRPQTSNSGPRMTTLEAVLFESGRPILIAPPTIPRALGENIVIAWNCSTESARAIAYALPLLARARQVAVLTIEEAVVPGPSGKEVADYLSSHGIEARELTVAPLGRKPGPAILQEAQRLGADLLIKGAYTQSRLRQMIFGGATSHILNRADLPVFMAH